MSFTDLINAFIPLLIIFGLLYGILIFVKKFSFSPRAKLSKSLSITVISNQMILPKKYISVVKVKDKLFVLGVSDTSINLLKELDYDQSLENEINEDSDKHNFMDLFKRNLTTK